MMKMRIGRFGPRLGATGGMVAAAVGFGALAVLGIRDHVAERVALERERLAPNRPVAQVVVARQDLPAGSVVSPETMALRELPLDGLPGSAVRPEGFDAVAGARLTVALRSGEPLIASALSMADPGAFAAQVRAGVRALTIAVDEVNALSGMLQPGDRIDLLLSARPPVRAGQDAAADVTVPLMQDVPVLATGRQYRPAGADAPDGAARAYTTITIEVDPAQAQKLIVAQRSGRLTALLRNPDDRGAITRAPMDLAHVLDAAPPAAPAMRAQTEVIVGGRGTLERRVQPVDPAMPAGPAVLAAVRPGLQAAPREPAPPAREPMQHAVQQAIQQAMQQAAQPAAQEAVR